MKKLFLPATIIALFGNFLVLAYYVNANRNNAAKIVFLEREYFAAGKVLHVYQETIKGWELYAEATTVVQKTYEVQLAGMRMTADKYLLLERVLYLRPDYARNMIFAKRLRDAVYEASKVTGVATPLILAVMQQESHLRPLARGAHGEIGLMQISLGNAKRLGYKPKDLYNVELNVLEGTKILAASLKQFRSRELGVLTYNRGIGAVLTDLRLGYEPRNGYEKAVLKWEKKIVQVTL